MISLQEISKTYKIKNNKQELIVSAVDNVSIDIEDRDIYGIIGFSGAGKSTLVRCINLIEKPDKGKVLIDNVDLTRLSPKELRTKREKIGMIFQHFNLMPSRTIFENIAFPLQHRHHSKDKIKERVQYLLKLVDISEKESAYPSELSGGQKQRVAIARALANEPNILLCDEATSALDPQTTKQILQLLKRINEKLGVTIVIITHEMEVIKDVCNKVAVMENGRVVEKGTVFNIFSNPKEAVTKRFINTTTNINKINELIEEHSRVTELKENEVIVRLSYIKQSPSTSLITSSAREFNIDYNIIFADIEIIGDSPIGGTVAIISGDSSAIDNALQDLRDKHVGVEVLKDGRIH